METPCKQWPLISIFIFSWFVFFLFLFWCLIDGSLLLILCKISLIFHFIEVHNGLSDLNNITFDFTVIVVVNKPLRFPINLSHLLHKNMYHNAIMHL